MKGNKFLKIFNLFVQIFIFILPDFPSLHSFLSRWTSSPPLSKTQLACLFWTFPPEIFIVTNNMFFKGNLSGHVYLHMDFPNDYLKFYETSASHVRKRIHNLKTILFFSNVHVWLWKSPLRKLSSILSFKSITSHL